MADKDNDTHGLPKNVEDFKRYRGREPGACNSA